MKPSYNERYGAVIVEFAICMPLLVFLTWGTIECSGSIFTKQTLTSAAHEGALVGMRLNATEAGIRDQVELILESRNVEDFTITVTPSGSAFEQLQSGESFTINVTKTTSNNFFMLPAVSVDVSSLRP